MNESEQKTNGEIVNQGSPIKEPGINFKQIIGKLLAFLPYFVISIIICLGTAFLVNKYSNPK